MLQQLSKGELADRFRNIEYLQHGSQRQKQAYGALTDLGIFSFLAPFEPLLAGTIPLGIETPLSDLDIICCSDDLVRFMNLVTLEYGGRSSFCLEEHGDPRALICSFAVDHKGFSERVEIYASHEPTSQSRAFRHMILECMILELMGEEFRQQIISLKSSGIKTEPAFCKALGIAGDPYERLLELESRSDEILIELLTFKKLKNHSNVK